jgi:alkylation response protein AidB-like acyl-CoA dehydrogenase
MGLTEVCLVLEAQGRHVAPVPLWPTLAIGALTIARFGSDTLKGEWLGEVASGNAVLTGALSGSVRALDGLPPVVATAAGDGWQLDGTELSVPQAHLAARIVVPAHTPDGDVVVALVDPSADGVQLDEIHPHLHLTGVSVGADSIIAGPADGARVLEAMLEAAITGVCALAVGVAEAALRQTAEYLNGREQFGKPLSTFQGTLLRAGDAAVDLEAMRVTLWQAAWMIDTGRDAREAVAAAKWQASDRGQKVVHATQHLHGGIGADITYPIHRYFLWGKQLELLLGGPSEQLSKLGALIVERITAELSA